MYLTFGHGSTNWVNGAFRSRLAEELAAYTEWARAVVSAEIDGAPRLGTAIELRAGNRDLARSYEQGTALCVRYDAASQPSEPIIRVDLLLYARLLGRVYDAEDLGRGLDGPPVEITPALDAVRPRVPRARNGTRQGYGLTAAERRAVEFRAMDAAEMFLRAQGYSVEDVSAKQSYDFVATRGGEQLIVEVKGTTGFGETILLTVNEVDAHEASYPRNMLILVHTISLDRVGSEPRASGGTMQVHSPWRLSRDLLRPLTFSYGLAGPATLVQEEPSQEAPSTGF